MPEVYFLLRNSMTLPPIEEKLTDFALSLVAKIFIKHLPLFTSTFVGSCGNA